MAVHATADVGHDYTTTGLNHTKLAMWTFLASDCLLFGAMISTYLLYRNRIGSGPSSHEVYDIPFTSVSSFVLLMSSLTMVLAVSAARRGDERNTRVWLVTTAVLGATFVGGQAYEFTSFYREGLGFTTSLFSSSFYTLTGFHGVHVTVGIVMLASVLLLSMRGHITREKSETVEVSGTVAEGERVGGFEVVQRQGLMIPRSVPLGKYAVVAGLYRRLHVPAPPRNHVGDGAPAPQATTSCTRGIPCHRDRVRSAAGSRAVRGFDLCAGRVRALGGVRRHSTRRTAQRDGRDQTWCVQPRLRIRRT